MNKENISITPFIDNDTIHLYATTNALFSTTLTKGYTAKGDYYGIDFSYDNIVIAYAQGIDNTIEIKDMALGYRFSYPLFGLMFETTPKIGIVEYSINKTLKGMSATIDFSLSKAIFSSTRLRLFNAYSIDSIDDVLLSRVKLGVGIEL